VAPQDGECVNGNLVSEPADEAGLGARRPLQGCEVGARRRDQCVRAADLASYLTSAPQGPSFSTPSMSVKGRGGGAMSDLLLPGTAYVDLEVHLPFAQRLGVGDHPIPALQAGRFRASAISEVIQPSRSWCVTCPLMRAAEGPVRKAVALPPESDSSPFRSRGG